MNNKKIIFIICVGLSTCWIDSSIAQRAWENDIDPKLIPITSNLDQVERYAVILKNKMSKTGHCGNFVQMIDRIASSGSPAKVRELQIDKIFDKSYDAGCVY